MKVALSALAVLSSVLLTGGATFGLGQVSLTPDRRPFLTANQLIKAMGDETTAVAIVSQALAETFWWRPNMTPTVIGSQIPAGWLPLIPNVTFVRLTDDEVRAHLQQCGRLLFINSLNRSGDVVSIAVAEGTRCVDSGLDLRFHRSADRWQSETAPDVNGNIGLPGGFAGLTGGCSCK
jgi:hypothetical protein